MAVAVAVAKELITAHGGTVSADSEPGGGTRMNLRLPRAESRGPRLIPAPGTEPRVA
ncbi:hypothetical protein [Streptomyces montanus]|uniref:hypothetical protein n=1 Tax=Streptomyces montanus TaxID=2580423 RepID=UPI00319DC488